MTMPLTGTEFSAINFLIHNLKDSHHHCVHCFYINEVFKIKFGKSNKYWGFHSRVVQASFLLGYDVMSFQTSRSLKIKALHSFKTLGTDYSVTKHHIPEQPISIQKLKCIISMICNSSVSNRNLNADSRQSQSSYAMYEKTTFTTSSYSSNIHT